MKTLNTYEILSNNGNVVALNQLSNTFSEEVKQLLEQGYTAFETVKAHNTVEALAMHSKRTKPSLSGKTVGKVVLGAVAVLWGMGFVSGLNAISSPICNGLQGSVFKELLLTSIDVQASQDNSMIIYKQGKIAGAKFKVGYCTGD